MKITRIVALAIIAASGGLIVDQAAVQAQTLRSAGPPSEFPPASYQGKQYVDSRGCVYIRAGIDGNVTWIPRVTRSRKQLCGYKPTTVAGAGAARPAQSGAAPELITLSPEQRAPEQGGTQEVASGVAPATPTARRPQVQTATAVPTPRAATPPAKPRRTSQNTSATSTSPAKPRRVVTVRPAPVQPTQPVVAPPRAQRPTESAVQAAQGGCSGASELSQRYINRSGVRCGPQAEAPVTYRDGLHIGPQSSVILTPNTRVVPRHVYQARQHSEDLDPPEGYRRVWTDDRLNLRRAERDLKPAILTSQNSVPDGYAAVYADNGRMNPMRGVRSQAGDAEMAMVWTNEIPRRLVAVPVDREVVRIKSGHQEINGSRIVSPLHLRLSTRSAPDAEGEVAVSARVQGGSEASSSRSYVRATTLADPSKAQRIAQTLAAKGLPVRLGTVSRGGEPFKVVLAGPFLDQATAQRALQQVRQAGFAGARISR